MVVVHDSPILFSVSKKEDFEDRSLEFAPSFTHQVFGEK